MNFYIEFYKRVDNRVDHALTAILITIESFLLGAILYFTIFTNDTSSWFLTLIMAWLLSLLINATLFGIFVMIKHFLRWVNNDLKNAINETHESFGNTPSKHGKINF